MKLKDRRVKMGACQEAIEWVGDRDLKTAWAECERGDWLLWYAERAKFDRKKTILATCECVRRSLRFVPPGEDRPRVAIEAAELAAKKPTTKNKAAAGAAWAAAWDAAGDAWAAAGAAAGAAWAAAGDAAWAAAGAAWAAAGAAGAAWAAAGDAAWAAAGAAWDAAGSAGAAELKAQADIIRKYFPRPR